MGWKIFVKRLIPSSILNSLLLTFPFLYHTKIVNFETNIPPNGIRELCSHLDMVLELEGNVIECGSSRCGASVIIANHLRARGYAKSVYACDSFEGFDLDELKRERASGLTIASDTFFTSTSYQYVQAKLAKLGVDDVVVPVKGFFETTLSHIDSDYCYALIDCDFRDSILYCAETIWPRLVGGGRILFDDYTSADFQGARLGIDHFVETYADEIEEHGLLDHLYFVKKVTTYPHPASPRLGEEPIQFPPQIGEG